jgi:acetolactate decarboxylase
MKNISIIAAIIMSGCQKAPLDSSNIADTMDSQAETEVPASLIGSPDVEIYGSLQSVFMNGDFSANANLAETGTDATSIGIGAIEGLRGEITILDGEAWLGYPDGLTATTMVRESAPEEQAALLVVSQVSDWVSFTTELDTTYEELTDVIVELLEAAYWPDTGALAFKVEGNISQVDWHVIDGSRLPEGQASHEDHEEASVSGTLIGGSPVMVGFYSTQHAGVITHGGVRIHLHVTDAEREVSGHVEDAIIGAGSTISFPAPTDTEFTN